MQIEIGSVDIYTEGRIRGYAWALQQKQHAELNEMASYEAYYAEFVRGTDLEEDPPEEANRAMSWEGWQRGVEESQQLLRGDSLLSVSEIAERARCDVSYVQAEILRWHKSGGEKGLHGEKVGKGRTSGYAVHPDDFRKWWANRRPLASNND